jgi:hypothetical protein
MSCWWSEITLCEITRTLVSLDALSRGITTPLPLALDSISILTPDLFLRTFPLTRPRLIPPLCYE